MVLPQLFAMVQVVAHCTTHKRPPFQSQAKGANMIGLRVIMVWWKNTKHETWYCGEVIGQTSEGVNVHYHDDGSTVTMTHSELLAKCKSNEGYVVPRAYWDAQVQNVEEDKKRWAEAIDADTLPLKPSLPGAIGRQAKRQKLSAASVSAAAAAQDNSVVSSTFGKVLTATSSRLEVGSIVSVEFNEGAEVPVAYEGRVLSSAAAETNGGGRTDVYEVQFFADDLVIPVNPDTHVMRLIKSSASAETQSTTVTGKHQPAEGDELSPSTGCTICLEEFINMPGDKRVTSLGCGHQFCSECIEGWFMLAANRSCPTCRKCFAGLRQATTTTIRDIAVGTGEHKPPSNKVVSKQRVPARTSDASHDRLSKPPRAWSEAETQQLMAMAPSDCKWPFADSRWEDAARSLGTNRSGAAACMKYRRQTPNKRTARADDDMAQVSSAVPRDVSASPVATRTNTKKRGLDDQPISRHVGVHWHAGRWRAQISHEGRNHELGFFDQHDEEAAARAYDAAARRLRGIQAHGGRAGKSQHKWQLNFPTDVELQSTAPMAASADPVPTRPHTHKRGTGNKVVSAQRVPARTSASRDRSSKQPRAWSEAETQQLMAMAPSDCKWPFADSRWEDAARSLGTNRSGAAACMKYRRQTPNKRTARADDDMAQVSSAVPRDVSASPVATRTNTKKRGLDDQPISRHVGVHWHAGRWRAQISHEGRNHELGFFDQHDEEAAAHAYDAAARCLRGPQAHGGRAGWNGCHKMWLNFPTDVEQLQSAAPRAASADPMPTRPNPKKRGLDDRPISKYLGVAWNTQAGKWRAQIRDKGRYHILGFFNQRNEEAAAHAYDAAARGLRGPHAHGGRAGSSGPRWQLNFPTDAEQLQAAAVEPVRADSVPTRNDDDEEAARATSKKRGLNDRPISRHMGVCWATKAGKWLAQIGHGGHQQCLGFFDEHNEEAAARAYDAAARRLRGTQAHGGQASSGRTWRLNFPTDVEQLQAAALGAASADPVPTRNEVAARETAKSQQESDDESGEYEVEKILERRRRRQPAAPSVMEYRVRWLGYGEEADTWEPLENLSSAQALVTEFDRCENLIGRRVRKKFIGCGIFEGTVSGHAGEGRLDVLYDDGEVKRVKLEALLKILLPPE